jgi:phage/plasmid-associated DNA primase
MPPATKTKRQLAVEAHTMAQSFGCILYQDTIYLPVDYETSRWDQPVPPERRMWLPLSEKELCRLARDQFQTMFTKSDGSEFEHMVKQGCEPYEQMPSSILIRTEQGLKELREDGVLYVPSDRFVPNILPVMLNTDKDDKARIKAIIVEWLNSEEEATALLRHLATALAPGWSAVRYVLLLGDGRNGKSVLMQMMQKLFGKTNVSGVSRQNISDGSPVVVELNGKLLNIIFDGVAVYLKDSGHEKSLVAGEEVGVRKLYSSTLTTVQTNALFIEGLNREPKSSDKSSALQERLVRFWFKNTYEDDLEFKEEMLSDRALGALLSLLLDNYVVKSSKSTMLAPTQESLDLKIEHMESNSLALQFLAHLVRNGTIDDFDGMELDELTDAFRRWRLKDGDLGVWTRDNVRTLFKPVVDLERKSKRIGGKVTKVIVVGALKKDAYLFVQSLIEEETDAAVVGD